MADAAASSREPRRPIHPLVKLLGGNLLGTAAGGVFFVVATLSLSIEEMGRYTAAISAQWVAVGLLGSGLAVATLRLAALGLERGERRVAAGVVVQAQSIVLVVTALVALAAYALHASMPERVGVVPLWVVGWAGARAFIDCIRSGLLANHEFGRSAMLMVFTAVTGLGALGAVYATGELTVERLLVAHVAGLASGGLLGQLLVVPLLRGGIAASREQLGELVRYARWPALSEGTRLLQIHLGPLMLITFAGAGEAGLFGVARYPAFLFDVIALSLYQYWLSTAVRRRSAEGLGRLLGTQLQLAAVVAVLVVVAAFAAHPLMRLFGPPFADAAGLFVWNAVDFGILLLLRPAESTYHGLHKPWLESAQRLIVLPLLLGGGMLLVPHFGAQGMVFAHIATGIAALGVAALLLRGRLDAAPVGLQGAPR